MRIRAITSVILLLVLSNCTLHPNANVTHQVRPYWAYVFLNDLKDPGIIFSTHEIYLTDLDVFGEKVYVYYEGPLESYETFFNDFSTAFLSSSQVLHRTQSNGFVYVLMLCDRANMHEKLEIYLKGLNKK